MKKVVSTILVVFILSIAMFAGYEKESIKTLKKYTLESNNTSEIYSWLILNSKNELGQPVSGITFKLKDFNNTFGYIVPETSNPGYYSSEEEFNYTFDQIVNMLPKSEVDRINKIKTREDIEKDIDSEYGSYYGTLYITLPLIVEQEKVPNGYIKEKYITINNVYVDYELNGNEIISKKISAYIESATHMEYKHLINKDTFVEDYRAGKYDDYIFFDCPRPARRDEDSTIQYSLNTDGEQCAINIIQEKGIVDLKINNVVNEKQVLTTSPNKTLMYKIEVENKGTTASTENIITTEVPKGLEYVENSASYFGKYDKENHEISWRIETIEADEKLELTYEATVPKNADPKIEYIGKTRINSNETEKEITSSETTVTILANPVTNNMGKVTVLIIAVILACVVYGTTYRDMVVKKKKTNKLNF